MIFQKENIIETLNTMTKTIKYIRTKPTVAKKLKSLLLQEPVKTVERQMNQETTNDHDRKRNEKQLKNIMYAINRAKNIVSETNAADNIIKVEEMTKIHPFVKSVKHMNGLQHPAITLFTDQQISDFKRFCCKEKKCCFWALTKLTISAIFMSRQQFIKTFLL